MTPAVFSLYDNPKRVFIIVLALLSARIFAEEEQNTLLKLKKLYYDYSPYLSGQEYNDLDMYSYMLSYSSSDPVISEVVTTGVTSYIETIHGSVMDRIERRRRNNQYKYDALLDSDLSGPDINRIDRDYARLLQDMKKGVLPETVAVLDRIDEQYASLLVFIDPDNPPETPSLLNEPGGPEFEWYEVQRGDTLRKISKRFYGSGLLWERIYAINRRTVRYRDPDLLLPGRNIKIPNIVYTVKPGDTLPDLAEKFYGYKRLWPKLYEANKERLQNEGPNDQDLPLIQLKLPFNPYFVYHAETK